ncbi:alpha-amylase family glycosyl hydrolase [Butyrivibrio sp. VCB2006]|uniref:alpha-amylase family glycosyl hydrolase n=1 Tax=Butyrivibrio sp. VCB2006 TaxID=1280679 RepID=UPI0004297B82|nr:alpha-amylase family glycosyl hydrolase [Butyrivibrio sp. VCB2006]
MHFKKIYYRKTQYKKIYMTLASLLSIAMLASCGKQTPISGNATNSTDIIQETAEESTENLPPLNIIEDKYRTTYEIFVYSFYDSDGDGIGDLQGVIDKLDYVNDGDITTDTDLGCNEIWLMPISPSPTYHKYDITDYKDIDPQYGTLEDFDNLVKECHDRGVNIIIDLVLNHTSSEHPWFKEAAQYLREHDELSEECPYLYYYNFATEPQTGYEKLSGTNWYYEARFWSGMPDLNLDNPSVKEEIADITQFWIDRGVDGFRLDAVTSYYTDNDTKNIEFMTWLNDTVKSQKEDAYMVGEGWAALSRYSKYYASGVDSFFDFEFSGTEGVIASVARSKKKPIAYANAIADAEKEITSVNEFAIDAPFFTNHDMARAAGYFVGRGSDKMVKMAGALNLLMGGNAFIYYGEELGMKGSGKDENKRAPMQWVSLDETGNQKSGEVDNNQLSEVLGGVVSAADADGMCDGPKDMDPVEMTYPALFEQAQDPYSIYNYYKKAIRLRNTYPVIARGKTQPIEVLSDDDIGAFVRYGSTGLSSDSHDYIVFDENGNNIGLDGNEGTVLGAKDPLYGEAALLIIINNGDEAKTIDLSKWSGTGSSPEIAYELNVSEEAASIDGLSLTIPSYGITVIK